MMGEKIKGRLIMCQDGDWDDCTTAHAKSWVSGQAMHVLLGSAAKLVSAGMGRGLPYRPSLHNDTKDRGRGRTRPSCGSTLEGASRD